MSARLYYDDCYLAGFDAAVVETTDGGVRVYLDRTAFYPESGGQPDDRGWISGIPIISVEDEGERIAHVLSTPLSAPLSACEVRCEIDWDRRYDHMQQHTGQHLLSAACEQLYGLRTVSFQMGADVSTIELSIRELSEAETATIEDRVNELARAALPISISYQEAEKAGNLRKASTREGELRIITIGEMDRSACGGTHVRSTAEVSPIQIRRREKVRGNVRVEFVCGVRAQHRTRQDYQMLSGISRDASCGLDELPAHIAQLRERLAESAKERTKLVTELARLEGQELYRQCGPAADGVRRVVIRVPVIDEAVRLRLQTFSGKGKGVAVAIGADPPGVLVQCSADAGINAGAVLKEVLGKFGGRGGGTATSAQGRLPGSEAATELAKALGFGDGWVG